MFCNHHLKLRVSCKWCSLNVYFNHPISAYTRFPFIPECAYISLTNPLHHFWLFSTVACMQQTSFPLHKIVYEGDWSVRWSLSENVAVCSMFWSRSENVAVRSMFCLRMWLYALCSDYCLRMWLYALCSVWECGCMLYVLCDH